MLSSTNVIIGEIILKCYFICFGLTYFFKTNIVIILYYNNENDIDIELFFKYILIYLFYSC